MSMESMENINKESKEKLCLGCRKPLVDNRCQNVQCEFFNTEFDIGTEEGKKGRKESPSTTDEEYIEEITKRHSSLSLDVAPEETKEEEKHKQGDLDQEVDKALSGLFKKKTAETLPANMEKRQRAIETAVKTAKDSLQREIDFGLSAGSSLRLMDKTDGEVEKFLEKSFCRSMEAAAAGLESLSKNDLIKIASSIAIEKAPDRIKKIFFIVLNNYIDKI